MYGGRGIAPASSRSSSTGRTSRLATSQRPSPRGRTATSGQPSPSASLVSVSPGRGRPRRSASHTSAGSRGAPAASLTPPPASSSPASDGRRTRTSMRPSGAGEDEAGGGVSDAAGAPRDPAEVWEALLRGRPRPGETLTSEALGEGWPLVAVRPLGDGRWLVASRDVRPVLELLEEAGAMPLPPYIHQHLSDSERYQTTYARLV